MLRLNYILKNLTVHLSYRLNRNSFSSSVTAVFYTESPSAEPLTSVTDGPESSGNDGEKPTIPRSRSERLLAINKEFVTQEKELREKYHDIIFCTAEKVMKTSQSNQIKALKVRLIVFDDNKL